VTIQRRLDLPSSIRYPRFFTMPVAPAAEGEAPGAVVGHQVSGAVPGRARRRR
jgi:hypothetical protein